MPPYYAGKGLNGFFRKATKRGGKERGRGFCLAAVRAASAGEKKRQFLSATGNTASAKPGKEKDGTNLLQKWSDFFDVKRQGRKQRGRRPPGRRRSVLGKRTNAQKKEVFFTARRERRLNRNGHTWGRRQKGHPNWRQSRKKKREKGQPLSGEPSASDDVRGGAAEPFSQRSRRPVHFRNSGEFT